LRSATVRGVSVTRLDRGQVRKIERTPQGGVRVDAAFTRVGVLAYRDGMGREWREYRPEEEVFRADSLSTLCAAPATLLHPDHLVTADTWRADARGHLVDDVRRDGAFAAGSIIVQDGEVARRVLLGDEDPDALRDLSCGYSCDVDQTPGVTPTGDRYDAVQRNIVYNHVALLPKGAGRAGTSVGLRMDAAEIEAPMPTPTNPAEQRTDADAPTPSPPSPPPSSPPAPAPTADAPGGPSNDAAPPSEAAKPENAAALSELDEVLGMLTDAAAKLAKIKALHVIEEAKGDAVAEASAPAVITEEVLDAAVAKRMTLDAGAKLVLGDAYEPRGKSSSQVRADVLAKAMPALRLDAIDATAQQHMVDAVIAGVKAAPAPSTFDLSRAERRVDGVAAPGVSTADEARRRMEQASADAWKSNPSNKG